MNISKELRKIAQILNSNNIEYALCGGLAVALHGYPRATQDIDLLVQESDLKVILSLLNSLDYNIIAGIIPFDVGEESERRIFRVSKFSNSEILTVDLVLVSPYLNDVWKTRETYSVDDYSLKTVSLPGLLKMKKIAGRFQDLADLERLEHDES